MIVLEQTLSSKIVDYLSLSLAKGLYPAFFAGVMVKRYNLHNLLFESKKVYTIALIAVLAYILTDVCGIHYSGGDDLVPIWIYYRTVALAFKV